jgi:hypothetical protein
MQIRDVELALGPVAEMLASDGYTLVVGSIDDATITVEIRAEEGACEECLVPQPVLASILQRRLADAALDCGDRGIELQYPAAAGH